MTRSAFPVHIQRPEKIDGHIVHPFRWLLFTFPFNFTGQPAATVPAGFTRDGLPIGLQIVGRHLDDPTVLRAAAACGGKTLARCVAATPGETGL